MAATRTLKRRPAITAAALLRGRHIAKINDMVRDFEASARLVVLCFLVYMFTILAVDNEFRACPGGDSVITQVGLLKHQYA